MQVNLLLDKERAVLTNDPDENGSFKTPGLRNIELRAPYMQSPFFIV